MKYLQKLVKEQSLSGVASKFGVLRQLGSELNWALYVFSSWINLLTHFQVEEWKIPGIHTMQEICLYELPNEKNRSRDKSSVHEPMSKGQRER